MNPFSEFALIIGVAAILGAIFTKVKQPAILGYIVTGLLMGFFLPKLSVNTHDLEVLSNVGVAFLLFILGMNLNITELKRLGKVSLFTGLGQIAVTAILGCLLSLVLGFSFTASLYIAIGLTFSSTIVILKLLTQKNQLETLHGRISVGFLLIQDITAILILVCLSASSTMTGGSIDEYLFTLAIVIAKAAFAIVLVTLFVKYILNRFLDSVRKEKEILFVTVIAWALALSAIMGSEYVGFSIEIGALIAGISLSTRFESLQIESWIKPLRDFFIIIFFVVLGLQINFDSVENIIWPAIIMSVFVIILKPLIVMIIMGLLNYSSKVGFYTSLAVAQISEFSLILLKFGFDLGHINNELLTLMTLIGGITMTTSSLMIYYNDKIYDVLKNYLKIFEFNKNKFADNQEVIKFNDYEILLFGCHRMGKRLLKNKGFKKKTLIVDFDPNTVKTLREKGFNIIYGDIADVNLYEDYNVHRVKIIVSTVPSLKENLKLIEYVNTLKPKPVILVTANDDPHAKELYKKGADVVVYPHVLGSELIKDVITQGMESDRILKREIKDIKELVIKG